MNDLFYLKNAEKAKSEANTAEGFDGSDCAGGKTENREVILGGRRGDLCGGCSGGCSDGGERRRVRDLCGGNGAGKVCGMRGADGSRYSDCAGGSNGKYIAVIDSGLGGISVLAPLCRELPEEKFLYFGDNGNAPYGSRTESDLLSLTMRNLDYILSFGVKGIVVACNTLSATLLNDIENYSGVKCFGVYPPVFPPLIEGKKTLLLATPFTSSMYRAVRGLYIAETAGLASAIEKNAFHLNNINIEKELNESRFYYCSGDTKGRESSSGNFAEGGTPIVENFPARSLLSPPDHRARFDVVILGCTHYFFVKNKIVDHLQPSLTLCGNDFTVKAVKNFFEKRKSSVFKRKNEPLFIGNYADFNEKFYREVVMNVQNFL